MTLRGEIGSILLQAGCFTRPTSAGRPGKDGPGDPRRQPGLYRAGRVSPGTSCLKATRPKDLRPFRRRAQPRYPGEDPGDPGEPALLGKPQPPGRSRRRCWRLWIPSTVRLSSSPITRCSAEPGQPADRLRRSASFFTRGYQSFLTGIGWRMRKRAGLAGGGRQKPVAGAGPQ